MISPMLYKSAVVAAVDKLSDRLGGSSVAAIRKHVQTTLPSDERWRDSIFLRCLNAAVDRGELIRVCDDRYKSSAEYRQRQMDEIQARLDAERARQRSTLSLRARPLPKETPKRGRPEAAKKKLLDRKVVTVMCKGRRTQRMDLEEDQAAASDKTRIV